MTSVYIIWTFCVSFIVRDIKCVPLRRSFDPNKLMEKYMKMRTNEGVFGSYHPFDVKNTVHQYFSLYKQSVNNGEQQQIQNQDIGQSKFDPNGDSMFSGKQSSLWKFASAYDPNENVHKYMSKITDIGSLGPVQEHGSGSGIPETGTSFDADKVNAEMMVAIKQQQFQPGMGSGMTYQDLGVQSLTGHFDPTSLNQELMEGNQFNPTTTNVMAIQPIQIPDVVHSFGLSSGSKNESRIEINMNHSTTTENVTSTSFAHITGTPAANVPTTLVVSKNPSLASGYHVMLQPLNSSVDNTMGINSVVNTLSSGVFHGIGGNSVSTNDSLTGSIPGHDADGLNTETLGNSNGGTNNYILGSDKGSMNFVGNVDQTGALHSGSVHATGIGGLGIGNSGKGSPVANGIGSLNGGESGVVGNFKPGSIGLPGLNPGSSTADGLYVISGPKAKGHNQGHSVVSKPSNFQNSVFTSSKVTATGIGSLGGSSISDGSIMASMSGFRGLGSKTVTQKVLPGSRPSTQSGSSVHAYAFGIGSLDPSASGRNKNTTSLV